MGVTVGVNHFFPRQEMTPAVNGIFRTGFHRITAGVSFSDFVLSLKLVHRNDYGFLKHNAGLGL